MHSKTALSWRAFDLCSSYENLSILGGAQIVHDSHKVQSLRPSLLSLRHMQVHFVAVKICIVWAADTLIEAQCPAKRHSVSLSSISSILEEIEIRRTVCL